MKYIAQKHPHGCAIASIAMVTDNDYDYVASFYPAKDFNIGGLNFFDYCEFFVAHGFSMNWKWPTFQAKGLNVPYDTWPPVFWADRHIAVVLQHSGVSHAIAVEKGKIHDPLDKNKYSLEHYKSVSQLIGIYKI